MQGRRSATCEKRFAEAFRKFVGEAPVYDRKKDASVGGGRGRDGQWAIRVEDLIRDAAQNTALRTLFLAELDKRRMPSSLKSSFPIWTRIQQPLPSDTC